MPLLSPPAPAARPRPGSDANAGDDGEGQEEDPREAAQSEALLQALVQAGAVLELPCPDFAAHGVATGVHLFRQEAAAGLAERLGLRGRRLG